MNDLKSILLIAVFGFTSISIAQKDSIRPIITLESTQPFRFDNLDDGGCYFSYFVKNKSNKKTIEVRSDGMGNKLTITTNRKGKKHYKRQYNSKWIMSSTPPCYHHQVTPLLPELKEE